MRADDFDLCHTIGTVRMQQMFNQAPEGCRYVIAEPVIDGLMRDLHVSVDLWNVRYAAAGRPREMLVGSHREFPSLNTAITATMFIYEKGWEEA